MNKVQLPECGLFRKSAVLLAICFAIILNVPAQDPSPAPVAADARDAQGNLLPGASATAQRVIVTGSNICFFKQCAANVVMDRWARKCSAWQNARRHLIARAEKSARIASRITICGTYLQRGALNPAWIFRPFRAGLDKKTVVH